MLANSLLREREIRRILTEQARYFNILVGDVSITSLTFEKEFAAAIEAKQVAAQEAERAKFIVEKAEQDKLSAVIQAQYMRLSVGALGISRQYCPTDTFCSNGMVYIAQ
ncbi:Prohibitin [Corchorus capsularis]|uniref:Prohibitin n=1 Tax=Corchorus capsularis TaxID=210143 RepID=A0A1R3GSZ4_COCAP|nr:Prohibitin [Corchorus capsularis]